MKKLNLLLVALLVCSFAIGQNLSEGFETWPPPGWTIVQGECSPTNDISQNGDQYYSGNYSARFSSYSSCGTYDEYLVTPELITTAGDQTFSFWYIGYDFGYEVFKVGWSSTGTDVTTDFTWGPEVGDASLEWQQVLIEDLPVGTKYVAIHYYSPYQYYLYIDDVVGPEVYVPPSGILEGTVTDFDTGFPIQGALIDITPGASKETVFTNEFGEYEITLAVGAYDITASRGGYNPELAEDVLISEGVTTTVDFQLTPVTPYNVPYVQDFEGDFPPDLWNNYLALGAPWVQTDFRAFTGTYSAYHNDDSGDNDSWLISPPIDLNSATDDVFLIYFENVNWASYAAIQDVYITTDPTAFADPPSAAWVLLNDAIGPEDTWQRNVYDISAYSGTVFIAFYYQGNFAAEWFIDDFQIVETGDIDGLVENLNTGNPEPDVFVEVFNDFGFYETFTSDPQGKFLAEGLSPGSYDIWLSKDGFFDALHEDIIVETSATTTVTVEIEPIAPVLLTAQYNDQQVTLEWEKAPEPEMDNIDGTTILINNDLYEPGQTLDLDLSFIYSSDDFEFICGFFMDFPDGVTVNSASDLVGQYSDGLTFNNETGDGAMCTWGIPNGSCGFGSLYSSGDFVVNITIAEDFLGLIEIPFTIYGDGFGNQNHEVSGTVDLPTIEFNIYRSVIINDLPLSFEYLTTVMGFYHVDLGLFNGQEYCYYITQIVDGEKDETQPSNIMCATPNLSPVIGVEPLSFFEVMNPDMIITRTMTITNTTGGPLDLEFMIGLGPLEGPSKDDATHGNNYQQYLPLDNVIGLEANIHGGTSLPATSETKSDLLWDNTGITTANSIISMNYNGYPPGAQLVNCADDFIVPPGLSWIIEEFYSTGRLSTENPTSGPIDGFTVVFYEDNFGEPGAEIYSETTFGVTDPSTQNIVLTSPPVLAPGTYWVSIYAMSSNTINEDRWNWHTGNPQIESEPALNDKTGLFGIPLDTWFPYSALGLFYGSQSFALYGTPAAADQFVFVDPPTGFVPPGQTFEVDVIFNSGGFEAGYYTDELFIYSNDLNNPEIVVPVAMEIFQPFLEVEAGHYSNELTITPIPENGGELKSMEGSYIEAVQTAYTPGETTLWNLLMYNGSQDLEWAAGIDILFPPGVTVTGATDFVGQTNFDSLTYDGTTGNGVLVNWFDLDGGWGNISDYETALADVFVTIDPGFTGPLVLDYTIYGDIWGADPHVVYGTYTLGQWAPFETSFNIYRDDVLIEEFWPETTYIDEPLPSPSGNKQIFCYTVTQNYEFIPPSAHSNVACGEPYGDGDHCDLAFEYAIVDDPTVFGTTTYTGDHVWYSVENPETQDFFVSLCGSDFDTKVAVYESCADWNGDYPIWYDYAGAIAYNDDSYTCGSGEPSYQSLTHVNWAAPGTYYVLVWGFDGEYGNYELNIYSQQSNLTRIGWAGLSTYVDLENKGTSMEDVFADVYPQLTILINELGVYWPGQNINSIGDFDTYSGHKAKWNDETTWIVEGDIVDDRTVTFPAGTHFLPVLNITPVEVQGFITDLVQVDFMFDVGNALVYWPDGGITPGVEGSLEYLFPGSAYLFRCTDEVTFDFTPFAPVDYSVTIPDNYFKTFENNTTWNDVIKTGDHHIVGLSQNALNSLEEGDYIGTFNKEGICVGMQLYGGNESALAMAVNGNDFTTKEVDGMIDQEFMNYRVYRDGQIYDVTAIYNASMSNHDGLFNANGLSQIIDFKFGPLSIEDNPMSAIMIFPNPSTGIFNIDLQGIENTVRMEVLNSRGQLIYTNELNESYQLDLTAQPQGVYFVRLVNSTSVHLEKIIIK